MTKEEIEKLSDAIKVLHKHFGGIEWKLELGKTSMFDPSDFKPFRPIMVNGTHCAQFDIELAQDDSRHS